MSKPGQSRRRVLDFTSVPVPPITGRDIARRHWYDLADPDCTPTGETMEWLRQVALKMIAADGLAYADRRVEVLEASGLAGEAYDADLPMIGVALREYERLHRDAPGSIAGKTAAEWVAFRLEWDDDHDTLPDSLKKRIERAFKAHGDADQQAWARTVLRLK